MGGRSLIRQRKEHGGQGLPISLSSFCKVTRTQTQRLVTRQNHHSLFCLSVLGYPTLPYPTLPYPTLPYPTTTLPYLPCPTHPTLTHPTLPTPAPAFVKLTPLPYATLHIYTYVRTFACSCSNTFMCSRLM